MKRLLLRLQLLTILVLPIFGTAQMTDLIFSEYSEGTSNNKYLELFNGTGQTLDLSKYSIWKITNDGFWFERDFPLSGFLEDGKTYLIVHQSADPALLAIRDTIGPPGAEFALFNGNEAYAIVKFEGSDTSFVDVIGYESGTTVPGNWDVAGVSGAGAEHTWIRKPGICSPNSNWELSAGTNADDSEWIVYEQNYWEDAGKHTTTCIAPRVDYTSELFFSEYGEGTANNKYLELFNGTGQDIDLSNYTIWKITNEGNWYEREFVLTGTLPHNETYMIVNQSAGDTLAALRDTTGPVSPEFALFNGNEAFALVKITGPDTLLDRVILDVIGMESGTTVPANWDVAGVIWAGAEHTWVRKPGVCGPNADWASSAGTNAEDSEWIVYDQDYWEDAGKHLFMLGPDPVFGEVPSDITVPCGADLPAPESVEVTYVNEAGQTIVTSVSPEVSGTVGICGGNIAYLYYFENACGISISKIRTVTFEPAPQASFIDPPADLTVDFADIPAPASLFYSNGAVAGCEISGTVEANVIDNSSPCGGSLLYNWTYTDSCGRTISHVQKINVNGEGGKASELFFSEYSEGTSNNKYLEIYNGTPSAVDLSNYTIWKITNEGNWFEDQFVMSGNLGSCQTYLIVNKDADPALLALRDTTGPTTPNFALFNGNEAYALVKITGPNETDRTILDVIGQESGSTVPGNWDVAGVTGAGAEHTWIRKPGICAPNSDWASSAGTNAENSEWIIFEQNYWEDAGKHTNECDEGVTYGNATDLFFSEYAEGSDNNKYLEVYNGTGGPVDLSGYTIWKITNEGNWFEREMVMNGILENNDVYFIVNAAADPSLLALGDTTGPAEFNFPLFNGNEAFALVKITGPAETDRTILDVIGVESGTTVPENWDVAGVIGAGAEHTWVRKPGICGPNPIWASSAGTNAENSEWIVYDQDYWADAGQHTFRCEIVEVKTAKVTFKVNMSQVTVSPDGVHLAGSFQDWNPATTQMLDPDGDKIFEVVLELPANMSYEYKFVNGNAWGSDEGVPGSCARNGNRFLDLGASDLELEAICYASCGPCVGVFDVTFKVNMGEQTVSSDGVHLAGNFQGWDPGKTAMTDPDGDGIYELTLSLSGGTSYQYKFVNGNQWGFDEAVPGECAIDNNRYLEVGTSNVILPAVCYGSCAACATGLINQSLDKSLLVYPNPTEGECQISFKYTEDETMRMKVYNALMQMVSSQNIQVRNGENQFKINIAQKGMFFISLESQKGIAVRQIIVD